MGRPPVPEVRPRPADEVELVRLDGRVVHPVGRERPAADVVGRKRPSRASSSGLTGSRSRRTSSTTGTGSRRSPSGRRGGSATTSAGPGPACPPKHGRPGPGRRSRTGRAGWSGAAGCRRRAGSRLVMPISGWPVGQARARCYLSIRNPVRQSGCRTPSPAAIRRRPGRGTRLLPRRRPVGVHGRLPPPPRLLLRRRLPPLPVPDRRSPAARRSTRQLLTTISGTRRTSTYLCRRSLSGRSPWGIVAVFDQTRLRSFTLRHIGILPTVGVFTTTAAPNPMPPTRTTAMTYDPTNPFIVQGDRSVLVEVDNPQYAEARDALAPFAELEKSPEHIHTYRLTPAVAVERRRRRADRRRRWSTVLRKYSKFPLPANLAADIAETVSAATAACKLESARRRRARSSVCADEPLLEELARQTEAPRLPRRRLDATSFAVEPAYRGVLKQALIARRLPGRGPGRLHRGRGAADRSCARSARERACRSTCATTSATRPTSSTPAATSAAAAAYRAALRRGQDHRRHRRHGAGAEDHAGPDHRHHRRQAVDARDPRQDRRSTGRPGRRVHRRDEGDRPGHRGDVPDPHLPHRTRRRSSRTSSSSTSATGA